MKIQRACCEKIREFRPIDPELGFRSERFQSGPKLQLGNTANRGRIFCVRQKGLDLIGTILLEGVGQHGGVSKSCVMAQAG